MHNKPAKPIAHPVIMEIKTFFTRLFQSPDTYTIKYYKKSKRYGRQRHELIMK